MSTAPHPPEPGPSLQRAWQLYRWRRYPLALEEALRFLARHPEHAEAHALTALIHAKEKRRPEARDAAAEAVRQAPDWSYPYYVRGLILYWFGEYEPAKRDLLEALRRAPTDPDVFEILAAVHAEQGHPQTSLEAAGAGLALEAEHVGCHFRRGVALFELKRHGEAEEEFRAVLRLNGEHAAAQGFLGHIAVRRGDHVEALPLLRNALRESPNWSLAQNAWRAALRGQYRPLQVASRLWHGLFEKHLLRGYFAVLALVYLVSLALVIPRGLPELDTVLATAVFGAIGVALVFAVLMLLLSAYLGVTSRAILLWDPELRRTIAWRQVLRQYWLPIAFAIYLLVLFLATAGRDENRFRSNRSHLTTATKPV